MSAPAISTCLSRANSDLHFEIGMASSQTEAMKDGGRNSGLRVSPTNGTTVINSKSDSIAGSAVNGSARRS